VPEIVLSLSRSIKELRDRVGSVKNTKKITSAMKLVAAAKVTRSTLSVCVPLPMSSLRLG
jgi:F-type H+-transporting ATPase subunit gamma